MKTIQISMKPNIFLWTKDEAGEGPGKRATEGGSGVRGGVGGQRRWGVRGAKSGGQAGPGRGVKGRARAGGRARGGQGAPGAARAGGGGGGGLGGVKGGKALASTPVWV